jgi:uncharacterized DUF497 family protein
MIYTWDENKNAQLRQTRQLSFEQAVQAIANGKLLDVLENPNQEKYRGQVFLIVWMNEYAHIVPAIVDEHDETCHLITIYPSRKYTKIYYRNRCP